LLKVRHGYCFSGSNDSFNNVKFCHEVSLSFTIINITVC
jgi:hypothetical protein